MPVPAGISANFYRFEEIKKTPKDDAKSRKNAVSQQVVIPRSGTII